MVGANDKKKMGGERREEAAVKRMRKGKEFYFWILVCKPHFCIPEGTRVHPET
uniref:Uncharacterized protein n=1 Tax=Anopheles albimanus TaxID=7167 RepID=A0A182FXJ1_ANOAL